MKIPFLAAFAALKKAGVPVYVHPDDRGNFSIDAERAASDRWVNFYTTRTDWAFGVSPELDTLLDTHGLYAEWVNPGRLAVYKA